MTGTLRKLPVWLQFSVGKMLLKLSKKTALRLSSWKLSTITLQKNDPKAVEVLAWMNARGIGIKPNLVEAFNLYQKAAALKVPLAAENALLVYKSMNAEQRRLVTGFKK